MALRQLKQRKDFTSCKDCSLYGETGCTKDYKPVRIGSAMGKSIYDCRYFNYVERKEEPAIIVAEKVKASAVGIGSDDEMVMAAPAETPADTPQTEAEENESKSGDLSEADTENEETIKDEEKTAEKASNKARGAKKTAASKTKSKTKEK
jgi:hypothetical protein